MHMNSFVKISSDTLKKCLALMKDKNKDYANEDNAFENLTIHAEMMRILELDYGNRLHQPLGHIIEKVQRLANLLSKKHKPKNESIEDSIEDIIVFALLFKGMWLEDRE